MEQKVYQQIRVIDRKDPEQFQSEVNRAQIDLAQFNPETIYDISDGYKAIIQWKVTEDIPETAQDEMSLQGIHLLCGECPRFDPVKNNDGSVKRTSKRGTCFLSSHCWADSPACEWACKAMLRGELEVQK